MKSLPEFISEVCEETHEPMVDAVFGKPGLDAVFQVMEAAKALYKHVEPERIAGQVIIFQVVATDAANTATATSELPVDLSSLANRTLADVVLEVTADGRLFSRPTAGVKAEVLATRAVVYRWQAGSEEFFAGDKRKPVRRLDATARSQFSVPTFHNLREALQCYSRESVRESTCYILRNVWHDQNRLFLKAKPEATMRNSLTQFLRNRLGGEHDVWPEQVVDESHPVDIRVQPKFANNRLMLVEIKWLGYSVAADGHITARHKETRAQEGADQLAQYLEDQRRSAPSHVVQGYYVIIDGRRENLQQGATTISRRDGMHYENQELTFNPAQHTQRSDFDPPYRMFATPVCNGD